MSIWRERSSSFSRATGEGKAGFSSSKRSKGALLPSAANHEK